MRVWTIQRPVVAATLQRGRTWRPAARGVPRDWRPAYAWMALQLQARVGAPPSRGQAPVWLWCQWRGAARARPDLRASGHLPRGVRGVRIELELDEARILRSDFELWHYVLNGWYLAASDAEERAWEARPRPGSLAASWRRIFELDRRDLGDPGNPEQKSVQAVAWDIHPSDVREVTPFVAR